MHDVQAAADRFVRFKPVLRQLFPELASSDGVIESPLLRTPALQQSLRMGRDLGRLFIKADSSLPVAGSIKARGGIHEVLEYAEDLAEIHGLTPGGNVDGLGNAEARALFGRHHIAAGSTGNLGLSIGVIASALGFQATIHMSSDAKQWKKERLRNRNVSVVEHDGDYAAAVAAGRREAAADPRCHFVDDEGSLSLFLGYSAAALHLRAQLLSQGISPSAESPLFVYLPCGVGGAPAGICFGLSLIFGPHVHCFFAEPTASPCFMVAIQDRAGNHPSVYDVGLDNRTEADGLAVPQASERAVGVMRTSLAGIFSVEDTSLFSHLYKAAVSESLRIEPSAAAGFDGPTWLTQSEAGIAYLERHQIRHRLPQANHILWTTGGLFVPEIEYQRFLDRGAEK